MKNGAVPIAKQPPRQTHGSYFAVAESGRPSQTEPCVGLCKPPDTLKPDYSHTKSTEPRPIAPQIITAVHRAGFFLFENVGAELDKT